MKKLFVGVFLAFFALLLLNVTKASDTGPYYTVSEGELTNGSVSPMYAQMCKPGLETINPSPAGLVGGGMLCYNPTKGTPVCKSDAGITEGWYYPNNVLLRAATCPQAVEPTAPVACTMEYAPVCANVQVECIKAPCPPVHETFGNLCMLRANPRATYAYVGECKDNIKTGEGYPYLDISNFLTSAFTVLQYNPIQQSNYVQTIIDKIDNVLMTSQFISPVFPHKYTQLKRLLQVYQVGLKISQ